MVFQEVNFFGWGIGWVILNLIVPALIGVLVSMLGIKLYYRQTRNHRMWVYVVASMLVSVLLAIAFSAAVGVPVRKAAQATALSNLQAKYNVKSAKFDTINLLPFKDQDLVVVLPDDRQVKVQYRIDSNYEPVLSDMPINSGSGQPGGITVEDLLKK